MKLNGSSIALLLLLTGFHNVKKALSIIGGKAVSNPPFFVLVFRRKQYCGGTLLTPEIVLTAAHCVFLEQMNRFASFDEVVTVKSNFSDPNWRQTATSYPSESYIYPYEFEPNLDKFYDIALIKLKQSLDMSNPMNGVLKPCPGTESYKKGLVIGMGLVQVDPSVSPRVLEGAMMFELRRCQRFFADVKIHDLSQVCYGSPFNDRPAGTCRGDSGGPIIHTDDTSDEPECLIGVNSFGDKDCDVARFPSIFTRLAYFDKWIRESVSDLEEYIIVPLS